MADAQAVVKVVADTSEAISSIKSFESTLKTALSIGAIVAFGVAMRGVLSESGKHLTDLSDTLGISAKSLQLLQTAAKLSSVGVDEFDAGLRKMSATIGESLITGSGKAIGAFQRLHLNLQEVSRLPVDQQFKKITAALLEVNNMAERNALARDIFGKQGDRLVQINSSLDQVTKQFDNLGISLTQIDTEALAEADNKLDLMSASIKGGVTKAMAELAPYIIVIVDDITKAIEKAGGFDKVMQVVKTTIKLATEAAIILFSFFAAGKIVAIIGLVLEWGGALLTLVKTIREVGIATVVMEALATGGLSAIATATLGVAGAILATKAANKLFDSVQSDVVLKQKELVTTAQAHTAELNKQIPVVTEIDDKMKEQLASIQKAIDQQKINNQDLRDKLSLGDEEAKKNKTINEIIQKTKELKGAITPEVQKQVDKLIAEAKTEAIITEELNKQLKIRDQLKGVLNPETNVGSGLQSMIKGTPLESMIALRNEAKNVKAAIDSIDIGKGFKDSLDLLGIQYKKTIQDGKETYRMSEAEHEKYIGFKKDLDHAYEEYRKDTDNRITLIEAEGDVLRITKELDFYKQLMDLQFTATLDIEQEKLRIAEEYSQKKLDLELARIQRTLMAEKSGIAEILSAQDKAVLQQIGAQDRQRQIVADRVAFEKKSGVEQTAFAIDQGAQMFNALGAQNKKAFEIAKAFNIANAIMNTYLAATKALATYPPPFGFIAAAAAIGMGLAQIAVIKSQQYSGKAVGGGVSGGQTYMIGERGPELFTPASSGSITPNDKMGGANQTTVNFNIVANDTKGFDQLLIQRKDMISKIIADAQMDKGRRTQWQT